MVTSVLEWLRKLDLPIVRRVLPILIGDGVMRAPGMYYWVRSVKSSQPEIAKLNHTNQYCFTDGTRKHEADVYWVSNFAVLPPAEAWV